MVLTWHCTAEGAEAVCCDLADWHGTLSVRHSFVVGWLQLAL
jgi:hypothetical protein